jgi:hypothetical protein
MTITLQEPLEVFKISQEGNCSKFMLVQGIHQFKSVIDPTGKSNRVWFVLEGSSETVGAPEGYFRQFEQARGRSQVIIS